MAAACGPAGGRRESGPAPAAARGPLAAAATSVGHLRVDILEVVRLGDPTLEVRFSATNTAKDGAPFDLASHFATAPGDSGTVADVHLVDAASRRKYFVIRDARGRPACSEAVRPIPPGETRLLWARFLAPPPHVSRIGVQVPLVPAVLDVPIDPAPAAAGAPAAR
jgi:hypothetical protein